MQAGFSHQRRSVDRLYDQAICDKEHTENRLMEQIFNQLLTKIQLCSSAHSAQTVWAVST